MIICFNYLLLCMFITISERNACVMVVLIWRPTPLYFVESSAGLTMVQVVHLNRCLWTRGPHNFTDIIFIHTKYIKNTPDRLSGVFFSSSEYSKTFFGGLCPGPRWGSFRRYPRTPSRFLFPLDVFGISILGAFDCQEFQNLDRGLHFSECTRASKVLIRHWWNRSGNFTCKP